MAEALVIPTSLVVCWAAHFAAPLHVVDIRLETVGMVRSPDDSDYFVKHIRISFP